jgi:hypothetical protein
MQCYRIAQSCKCAHIFTGGNFSHKKFQLKKPKDLGKNEQKQQFLPNNGRLKWDGQDFTN